MSKDPEKRKRDRIAGFLDFVNPFKRAPKDEKGSEESGPSVSSKDQDPKDTEHGDGGYKPRGRVVPTITSKPPITGKPTKPGKPKKGKPGEDEEEAKNE